MATDMYLWMLAVLVGYFVKGVAGITLDATDEGRKLYTALGYQPSDECMYFDVER